MKTAPWVNNLYLLLCCSHTILAIKQPNAMN